MGVGLADAPEACALRRGKVVMASENEGRDFQGVGRGEPGKAPVLASATKGASFFFFFRSRGLSYGGVFCRCGGKTVCPLFLAVSDGTSCFCRCFCRCFCVPTCRPTFMCAWVDVTCAPQLNFGSAGIETETVVALVRSDTDTPSLTDKEFYLWSCAIDDDTADIPF